MTAKQKSLEPRSLKPDLPSNAEERTRFMQLNQIRCLFCLFLLSTILGLVGCGGGSSAPYGTTGQVPKPEVLYANSSYSVMSFAVDPSTGDLTKISTLLLANGENGEDNILATPSGAFVYSGDEMQVGSGIEAGISGYSTGGTGSLAVLNGFPLLYPANEWFTISGLATDLNGEFLYAAGPPNSIAGFTINSAVER